VQVVVVSTQRWVQVVVVSTWWWCACVQHGRDVCESA
jgi:hypothetical protein